MLQPTRRFGTAHRVGRRPIRPANKGLWRAGSRGWQAVLEHAQVGLAHLLDKALEGPVGDAHQPQVTVLAIQQTALTG